MTATGSWEYNIALNQLFGTPEFYEAIGLPVPSRARMKVEQFIALVHPDDRANIDAYWNGSGAKGGLNIDFRIVRPDGNIRWMHAQMKGADARSCVGIVQDRTEMRDLEKEAQLAHHNLAAFIERHIDPIVIWNTEGVVVGVNKAFTDLFGYAERELAGMRMEDCPFIPESYREELERYSRQAIENDTAAAIETVRRTKDGALLNILLSITPLAGPNGRRTSWIAILQNITQKIDATRRMQEAQQEMESFVEYNTDAIGFFSRDGLVRKVNPAFERMFGWTYEELAGMPIHRLPFASGQSAAEAAEAIGRILSGSGGRSAELQGRRKDGTSITVLLSLTPYPNRDGFALMVKDVSELKETRDMLGRSEMLSVIGQLAAGVAHEIKNPLTSLKGFARLLEPSLREKERRYIGIMKDELDRIELIVNEMLVLSKPQAMEFESKDMRELLDYVIELLGTQAIMKSIEIVRTFERVPPIDCEERQIKQVFVNLLKNAVEAMEDSGIIRVELGMAETADHIRIRVSDQGPGIPKERLARLTEPFYTTKEKGTGLGLMTTASIIERHGGTIAFDSELGVGTVVTVSIPVSQPS